MKKLIILRHAKSSWKNLELADFERPLNKRGKRDAPRMGRLLREENIVPDLIISSSAKRARLTAEIVAEESGYENEIIYSRDLYAAWTDAFIYALNNLESDYECVMVVGHNPGLEELIEVLTDEVESMPTAAVALVELPIENWDELDDDITGELVEIWRPKELN
jgi:phosphohistidine phosphatase